MPIAIKSGAVAEGSHAGLEFKGFAVKRHNAAALAPVKEDSGTIFHMVYAGAMTVTLPQPFPNGFFRFVNLVDQTLTVATTVADTLITFNDVAADSVAFDQGGNKIGAVLDCSSDGTSWVAAKFAPHTWTVNT